MRSAYELTQDVPDADTFKYPKKLAHMLIMDNAVLSDVLTAKDRCSFAMSAFAD